MSSPELRIADADRDRTVELLRTAATEGRLDSDELEERVSRALAARTQGELDALVSDLPAPHVPAPRPERSLALRERTAAFLTPNVVCIAVWAATGAGYFWPAWVLLGTGIGFAVFLIRWMLGVDDRS
jgi:Domain of unknown function (DUF1707)